MNQNHGYAPGGLFFIALVSLAVGAESGVRSVSLERIFNTGSFNRVFPLEEEVVETYGQGCTKKQLVSAGIQFPHEVLHDYFDPQRKMWVRAIISVPGPAEHVLIGVLVTELPIASTQCNSVRQLGKFNLLGIKVGDSITRATSKFGKAARRYKGELVQGKTLTIWEYFPRRLGTNSSVRFYADAGRIVAICFSNEE
jgi:hypothetical protein